MAATPIGVANPPQAGPAAPGTGPATAVREAAARWPHLSLRAKGMLAFAALVLYIAGVGSFVAGERAELRRTVAELDVIHALEGRLAKLNTSVAHTVLKLQEAYYGRDAPGDLTNAVLDIEAIQAGLERLRPEYDGSGGAVALLERNLAELRRVPTRGALAAMRTAMHELVERLDEFTRSVNRRKDALSMNYRRHYDAITTITIAGAGAGVVVFGALITLFFTRLARDLRRLEARALDVVSGYRGAPLPVSRGDEIGGLMRSVNHMQSELREHEKHLEVSRQQRFHQDKMAALGSLASAIAHEINNPIAAIHGLASVMSDAQRTSRCGAADNACQPGLILEETRRIAAITRQLSELGAPRDEAPALIDVNSLVRSTCRLIAYDRRFRRIKLELNLDPAIPAAMASADHVTQVLMNLLINAADATESVADRAPVVRVASAVRGDAIEVSVSDNGCGMDAATLARAFDETFTTKPAGKGSGLGLYICRSLLARAGGRIALESRAGAGTRAAFTVLQGLQSR